MNTQARTFHEDHLQRKAQSIQLAFTRAVNSHDGSAPLYLHQETDFLGHFEPDTKVSLAMVPEVLELDPVAGVLMMTAQLDAKQSDTLITAAEKGGLSSTLLVQMFGPTNLPGNLASLIEARAKAKFTGRMAKELRSTIASGKARTVKLGNGVELKAVGLKGVNKLRKHADVLLRVRQTNTKQITMLEKKQFQAISKNMSIKSLGPSAFKYDKVLSLSRQMADEMWELRRLTGSPWLGSVKVGGVLSFAPTLVDDVLNNYNHHAKLEQRFNKRQFAVDTITNQTGNVLAVAGGAAAAKITAFVFGFFGAVVAGAPLVVIGVIIGGLILVGYAVTGASNMIREKANALFGEEGR